MNEGYGMKMNCKSERTGEAKYFLADFPGNHGFASICMKGKIIGEYGQDHSISEH
jgi:hypothetical protein